MSKSWPKISYCVFTFNEEKNIKECLKSIFSQDYPKDKLEVIVVDDKSTDRTLEIAKKFPVKIYMNGKRDGDLSATIGFDHASGDFFTAIGADMRFRGKDWFKKMVLPMIENPKITASLTRYYSHTKDSIVTRYLNLDPIQRDLVYQFFSTGFDKVIVSKKNGYFLCKYSLENIPPQTHGLWRRSILNKVLKEQKIYYDMGNLIGAVKRGYTQFAYVPSAGYYHFHAESLKQLLKKRLRNIEKSYLRYKNLKTQYMWFDLKKPKDIIKMIFLVLGANLFLPIFVISIYRMIKNRNWLYILDAPITLLLVDTILFGFLKDKRTWGFILGKI